jgi:hypothetical protein
MIFLLLIVLVYRWSAIQFDGCQKGVAPPNGLQLAVGTTSTATATTATTAAPKLNGTSKPTIIGTSIKRNDAPVTAAPTTSTTTTKTTTTTTKSIGDMFAKQKDKQPQQADQPQQTDKHKGTEHFCYAK